MRHLLTILLLSIRAVSYGQTCDTIDGRIINCLDSLGQKQGYWKETKKVGVMETTIITCGANPGYEHYEQFQTAVVAEGYYDSNQKIKTWNYYKDRDDKQGDLEKSVTYSNGHITIEQNFEKNFTIWYSNGRITQEKNSVFTRLYLDNNNIKEQCRDYIIEFNPDTSFVVGQAYINHDTIQISCKNKLCNFKTTDGIEFLSFPSDKFESRLILLTMGEYNREIRFRKTSR